MNNVYQPKIIDSKSARRCGSAVVSLSTLVACGGLVAAVLSIGCAETDEGFTFADEEVVRTTSALSATADKALVITATSVTRDLDRTEDPCSTTPGDENKVWTIGHMLKKEAEKTRNTTSNYVSSWMNAWTAGSPSLNGQTVPPLLGPWVRDNWQRFAGGSTALPLHKAPFWLLAIVSRFDLRKHRPAGEPLGGEVRFVFGFLAANTNNPACPTTESDSGSTIILEYSINKSNENEVRDFARRWLELSQPLDHQLYLDNLTLLTEEVIDSGKLLRIRTNEGPSTANVGGSGAGSWDMGEFEPHPTTKLLRRSTIKQSPTMALAGGTSLPMADWIWANRDGLLANALELEVAQSGSNAVTRPPIGSYSVPDRFPSPNNTTWFRGSLNTLRGSGEFWNAPAPAAIPSGQMWDWIQARFRFSVGTCRGCHGGDTGTPLLHIGPPGIPGQEAVRSAFLRGPVTVADRVWTDTFRSFDEMTRRENDLRGLVNELPVTLPVLGNNYKVRFHASGKCLDSVGNTTSDGALSALYDCHGKDNQRLSLVPAPGAGAGVYNLKYKHSGKCIDVQNASVSSGARIEQRTCDSTRRSQQLTLSVLTGTVPNSRVLRFKHSLRCLVPGNGTADGTPVFQATCPIDFAKGFHLVE